MPYAVVSLSALRILLRAKRDGILQWTVVEETNAINEALRTWNFLTGRWRRRASQTTVATQIEYALPATMIYGMRVTQVGIPLTITSLTELDFARPAWRTETVATGGNVPTAPTLWAPVSLQRIAIWPAFNSIIVNGLTADGVSATPQLVEEDNFIDLGQELLDVFLNYCLHLLAFKLGGSTWTATMPFYRLFLQAAAAENGILKANQKFRRWAGLNRRIDLQKAKGEPNHLDTLLKGMR